MAGLQRSSETFRRSGSSGLVWEDKDFSGEVRPAGRGGEGADAAGERSRSSAGHEGYRAAGRVPPALDPPSPRVTVCGFVCTLFGGGGKGRSSGGGRSKAKGRRRH